MEKVKRRWSFWSKNQMPFFMVWDEFWDNGRVIHAAVVFNSRRWFGV